MAWYITIQEGMRELGLKGNELIVYAFLNGYSQDGQGCYFGSLAHLQEVCGIASRQTATDILKSLVAKGLINKVEQSINGIRTVSYTVCPIIGQGGVQKMDMVCPENGHNNKIDNKYNINNIIAGGFNFRSSLLSIGVHEDVADAWLKVRRNKKATNTEIAFNRICREIELSGKSANECITIAVENSWQGFKAEWLHNRAARTAQKGSVLSQSLKVMDRMFGTDLHQQAYGGEGDGQ